MKTEFSNRMKDVFNYVREEVLRLGDESVGIEHLFLGILREGEGTCVTWFRWSSNKILDQFHVAPLPLYPYLFLV